MSYLLSVVIPSYNCEATLERAVTSVLNQPRSDEIEIILVDDGSKDGTPALCDKLAKKNSNVFTLHQQNRGEGPARNAGIDIAKGKYLAALDSDDWWGDNVFDDTLVQMLLSENVDIYGFSLQHVSPDHRHTKIAKSPVNPEDVIGSGRLKLPPVMHVVLFYRLDMINDYNIRYPSLKVLADGPFRIKAASVASTYRMIDRVLYHYYINPNSFYSGTTDAAIFRSGMEGERIIAEWAQQNAPGVVIDPRGTLSNIVKYLPRHCAAHSYADTLEFFDDPLYAVMKDPALQPWTRFRKDWALWKKDSKRFWLKSRLIWGIPCALKASRTKKPFIKLKNAIWYRLIKRIY